MWDAAFAALGTFLDPSMLIFLLIGVIAGLVIGVIPGLGGTGAVAVLLPFVFVLEPAQAMAMIIGAVAVVHTSDAVTSILIGIPGSASASVLLLDGHEMAKKGQGARALSASFLASMVGGLIGVVALTFAIPVARPLVLMLGSPEIFMLTVLGISLTALLSKGNIIKGLMAGVFGIFLAQIGGAPTSPEYRYTFGSLYLSEGLGLVAVALGIFGVAEIIALVARKQAIAQGVTGLGSGWIEGAKDVVRHWTHVVRGSAVGVLVGILPGVGATAGSWMAYGQAQATARGESKKSFGHGDPRGVIAPSAAGNSVEAGALIPTLLFGIPGAAPFALLLGALLIFGIEPGPRILTDNLDTVYVIVWSFAIASVLGAAFCFILAKPLAKLSFIRFPLLAAAIIPILFMSGFQEPLEMQVFWVMIILGILGWLMKTFSVPRAPFLIGFVLAVPLERYYFLTANLYEFGDWFTRPAVLVMVGILVLPLILSLVRRLRNRGVDEALLGEGSESAEVAPKVWGVVMTASFLALFIAGFVLAQSFSEAGGLFPRLATGFGIAISIIALVLDVKKYRADKLARIEPDLVAWHSLVRTVVRSLLWILGYVACVYVLGMIVGTAVYVPVFLWLVAKARLRTSIIYPIVVLAFLLALQEFAQIVMPIGYLDFGI
ncbi:tripartite tricarboxylate transporter permease [Cryobacterium sp. N19]|uniref:tripartite tricarboxylate transporter permease n=1 Tax=Cryobacterium sp. N19 TaxID=2048288 RepID=UPI000CE45355|nr:tripartite tricarboxylate transporter permease [Cryobacterium sp. N19]